MGQPLLTLCMLRHEDVHANNNVPLCTYGVYIQTLHSPANPNLQDINNQPKCTANCGANGAEVMARAKWLIGL